MFSVKMFFLLFILSGCVNAEFLDRRCSCVCPALDIGPYRIIGLRAFYQNNDVRAEDCNCRSVVIPYIKNRYNGSLQNYCLECDCHYELRSTMILLIAVISLLGIISMLVVYMACLHVLQKLIKRSDFFGNQRRNNEEQLLGLMNIDRRDSSSEET